MVSRQNFPVMLAEMVHVRGGGEPRPPCSQEGVRGAAYQQWSRGHGHQDTMLSQVGCNLNQYEERPAIMLFPNRSALTYFKYFRIC